MIQFVLVCVLVLIALNGPWICWIWEISSNGNNNSTVQEGGDSIMHGGDAPNTYVAGSTDIVTT